MVDLLDIAPPERQGETVLVLGQEVEIRPLTVGQLAQVMRRFPELRHSFFRSDVPEDVRGVALLEAWPAIIAAGLGHLGEAPYEAAAERLPQAEMLKLGHAIMALTNPEEAPKPGPLPGSAAVIAEALAGEVSTSSPPPSNG